jgi:curved DNA-binding protein
MSAQFKDYYAILGVGREASPEEIKKAFRKLARLYHPDMAQEKTGSEEKFKEINEAHEVLSDPGKRTKYDQLGAAGVGGASFSARDHGGMPEGREFHFGGTGFSDFFEHYFSGATRYRSPHDEDEGVRTGAGGRARRGHDIEGDILVTLDEAMHGTQRPVSLQSMDRRTGRAQTHSFQVRIPPGAMDGRRIRVPGQGEPGVMGGAAGDLYLRVRHAAHPDFTTREADVLHELPVAPWEAVLGAEVVVPTLDGSIKLKVPPGFESGQMLRVKGRGLPKGKSGERGDFLVVIQMVLPPLPSEAERALWEQLRSVTSFHPRS